MKRRRRPARRKPELSIKQILAWADAWFARTGQWPRVASGRIPGSDGETWANIESNLRRGERGLPYRTTLARLMAEHRGVRNRGALPPFTAGLLVA
jgi:hypothetical protein